MNAVAWDRIIPLAETVGHRKAALIKWKQRGGVPARWHLQLLRAAVERGIPLTADELAPREPERKVS